MKIESLKKEYGYLGYFWIVPWMLMWFLGIGLIIGIKIINFKDSSLVDIVINVIWLLIGLFVADQIAFKYNGSERITFRDDILTYSRHKLLSKRTFKSQLSEVSAIEFTDRWGNRLESENNTTHLTIYMAGKEYNTAHKFIKDDIAILLSELKLKNS